jgi:hypothetical protein
MANEAPGGGPNAIAHVVSKTGNEQTPDPKVVENPPVEQVETPPVVQPNLGGDQLVLEQAKVEPVVDNQNESADFGDVGLNIAAEYFTGLGLDLNGRELTEAGKGNFLYLEAKLEALGDKAKGSGGYVSLAKEAVTRIQGAAKAKGEQAVKDVHDAVGGEANWTAVRTWATSNLKADQLGQASAALNQFQRYGAGACSHEPERSYGSIAGRVPA